MCHFVNRFIIILLTIIFSVPALAQDMPIIRYGTGEDISIEDSITFLVIERLNEKGYEIELTFFARPSFAVESLASGDVDFATFSIRTVWGAAGTEANIVTVAEDVGMDFVMIGLSEIESCEDWEGRTIAYNSETSSSAAIGEYYFNNICTDFAPEIVYVTGPSNRVAAMLSGAIDATSVHLDSALETVEQSPDKFSIIANLSEELPWLVGSGVHISPQFMESHPEAVQDIVLTLVQTLNDIQDDQKEFVEFTANLLELEIEKVEPIIQAYIDNGMYDLNLNFEERVIESLAYFIEVGRIPEDVSVDDLIDLSFLEVAFDYLNDKDK